MTDEKECFKSFNPVTPEHLEKAKKMWTDAVNSVIVQVIDLLDGQKPK